MLRFAGMSRSVTLLSSCVLLLAGMARAADPEADAETRTDPYELLDHMGQALMLIEREYYEPADQETLLKGAVRGMVAELDPHSDYFSREDRAVFEGSTSGRFGGIGVEVEFKSGEVIVIAPVEGSPADRAKIRPGDRIIALDKKPITALSPHELVKRMRGKIGSTLHLTVKSKKGGALREVDLVREEISVESVRGQLMDGGIAYLRIKAFQDGTHKEFLRELGRLRAKTPDLSGVILDLRNNPGGLVREAAALADEFLTRGNIYSTRHRGRTLSVMNASRGGALTRGPVVVLINEFSASAAELVAGALRDSGRARLVGAQTFGKGSVQTLLPLGYGGALKLTTALYFTPGGQTTQAKGVSPHIPVDPGYDEETSSLIVRESDLSGHLKAQGQTEPALGPARGIPPTNDALHLGVARTTPQNPLGGPDLALAVAYETVLSLEKSE